jgi:two-component system OmpR family response regulator
VHLTATEFTLLRCLLVNAGRVVTRAQILDHVWQYDFAGESAIIESFISTLRKKVDATTPRLIHTVRGVGYTIREP